MEYSYLFYGFYNNTIVEDRSFSYNIPLAYLCTAVFYSAFCLICIIARSVQCVCVFFHWQERMTFKTIQSSVTLTYICILTIDWLLTHSMGTAAQVAVATGGSAVGNYSKIVFIGWDYGCLGDQATKLKQKNLHYRLQVRRDEGQRKENAF